MKFMGDLFTAFCMQIKVFILLFGQVFLEKRKVLRCFSNYMNFFFCSSLGWFLQYSHQFTLIQDKYDLKLDEMKRKVFYSQELQIVLNGSRKKREGKKSRRKLYRLISRGFVG